MKSNFSSLNFHQRKFSRKDFEIGKKIGMGRFGHVYIVREIKSGFVCCLKVINKDQIIGEKIQRQLRREIEIQSRLKHPNIVKLFGHFHDKKNIYIIMEYVYYGELYKLLKKAGKFSEKKSANYLSQLTKALSYCHGLSVIHRDIKPENLLLDVDETLKICDFGMAVFSPNDSHRTTLCGTLDYLAPEMVEKSTHNETVDMWCLGILLYEFLVGKAPFASKDAKTTYLRIKKVELSYPSHVTKNARDLISKLLVKNSRLRLTTSQVLDHPFIRKYVKN